MSELTVALLQIEAAGYDQSENLRRGEAACRRAAAQGADIALFPEMWNIGYGFEGTGSAADLERWRAQAVPRGWAPSSGTSAAWRRNSSMAIAITYLEDRGWTGEGPTEAGGTHVTRLPVRETPSPSSTGTARPCSPTPRCTRARFDQPEASCTPGEAFPVATLDTAAGAVKVGAMICFDREFPETARILALEGAELILVPNACPMEENRTAQLRARAFENMVAIALANYPASHPDCDGHSVAFHPFAHTEDEVSRDTTVVRAGGREQIALARFDLDELRAWRAREVWGAKYRHPRLYGRLVEE